MKAVLCKAFGGIDDLSVEDTDPPVADTGEAIVDVDAVALNFADTLMLKNRYQFTPELPFSPGAEFAGTVLEVGQDVDRISPGDRVAAYCGWGAARELVSIDARKLIRLPDDLAMDAAAGLLVTYGTALHGLKNRAQLQSGETVAVLGAAGGAGVAAVEIAKLMGARVVACASSDEKLDFARAHGADQGINYRDADLKSALKSVTDGAGVDVVYDTVGGELAELALRATAWKGRYMVVGFAAGDIPAFPLNLLLLKGLDVRGVFWGRFNDLEPQVSAANNAQIIQWAAEGRISAEIHGHYPLEQAAEALGVIARREAKGKVILLP
ncbi:MAG: NADPH:quinone oxidoreductase family protein [Pseudomonadota bacterium]